MSTTAKILIVLFGTIVLLVGAVVILVLSAQ
jgi:hypothetical protein